MSSSVPVSPPLIVVDGANVVGSVPDGWWRDRKGANERLRDALSGLDGSGLAPGPSVPEWATRPPLEVVLVVEGAARGVESAEGVRVLEAPGSGDDRIVEEVARALQAEPGRLCLVVTADRELRERVRGLGAQVAGPSAVRG